MSHRKQALCALAVLSLMVVAARPLASGRRASGAAAVSSGYAEVKDWPKLPADVQLGEVPGVDIDSHGHVFIFHRPGRGFEPTATELLDKPAMVVVDANTGRMIASWGAKTFLVPHGVTIDREDNVWVTDVGLQQVMKFSHDGKLLLKLGEARVGGWDATHFNQPTDIAILDDGSFYVSDGYVNSRVAHFDRAGKLLHEWGSKGSGEGQFSNPHGLAFGPAGTIFVADRENSRVQVFDQKGAFKRLWLGAKDKGRVFQVATAPDGSIFAGVRRADYDPPSNGVLKLDREWRIVSSTGFGAEGDPVFNAVHDLAIGKDGSVYVAETRTKRAVKLRPR
jgi:peptidylamidoglycolate lyase